MDIGKNNLSFSYYTHNIEPFCNQMSGDFSSYTKQAVLQRTPAVCSLIQFNSATVYLEIAADPTDRGISPTRLYLLQMTVARASRTSDHPAINLRLPQPPPWVLFAGVAHRTKGTLYLCLLVHYKGYRGTG